MQREITDAWLRTLVPPATGRIEIWDRRVRGLVLRVTANGTFSWSARARTAEGKRTRPKLGTWPAMGLSEARKLALAATADIQRGGDPVAARRAAKAARAARAGLPTVADRLVEWQAAKAGQWSDRYRSEVARLCSVEIVPKLGRRPLLETTRLDWTDLIAVKHRRSAGVGSMLYRTAAAFLNHAEAHGWVPLPLLPRKGLAVIAPPVPARERVLTDAELRAIWLGAETMRPKPRAFVRLLAMTAAREMEVADIATGEIDFNARRWAIPGERTKNHRGIVVPLHPLLIAELRAVWPEHGERAGSSWRLLGGIAGSGLRGFSPIKRALDKASGVTGWRWHDLRRTARTGFTRLGVSRDHAEAALNHISGRTALERVYDRHDFAPEVIAAIGRWQAHVAALVTDPPSAEVVPLRRSTRL
jgi:integrase